MCPARSSTLVPVAVAERNLGPQLLGVLRAGGVEYRPHGSVQLAGALAITRHLLRRLGAAAALRRSATGITLSGATVSTRSHPLIAGMATHQRRGRGRGTYHHGDLRETLIMAALEMIAERGLAGFAVAELARAVGVSQAAPYRHFRDRNALVAEIARRGFEQLGAELDTARRSAGEDPIGSLERCAQAHLAFAARDGAVYAAMFESGFPAGEHPELTRSRDGAFAVVRQAAQAACEQSGAPRRPPAHMVALHVWSLTHGIADLYASQDGDGRARLPMLPEALLEAGLLVYLASLDIPTPMEPPR